MVYCWLKKLYLKDEFELGNTIYTSRDPPSRVPLRVCPYGSTRIGHPPRVPPRVCPHGSTRVDPRVTPSNTVWTTVELSKNVLSGLCGFTERTTSFCQPPNPSWYMKWQPYDIGVTNETFSHPYVYISEPSHPIPYFQRVEMTANRIMMHHITELLVSLNCNECHVTYWTIIITV